MAHKKNTINLTELLLQCVTEMCDGAGSDAEYAGMAVHRAHGGRVDQQRGPWSVHAQAYHFRCTRRTGFGNS